MNIPTANVIVSFSADSIRSLFESGGSTKSLIKKLEESGDLLLFNKESNPNFISFEYSFGLGGGQHTATLKFLDPENEFEGRFFTKGFAENIAGFKPAPDTGLFSPITTPSSKEAKISREQGVRDEFLKRYIAEYGNKHLYLAYGSGFNTDAWAGPYKMFLQGASIEGSKGKVITLKLTPTPQGLLPRDNRTATGNDVNLHLNGLYTMTTGESDQLNLGVDPRPVKRSSVGGGFDEIYHVVPYLEDTQKMQKEITESYNKSSSNNATAQKEFFKTSQVDAALGGINYHDMIVDCLKDYISKATGNKNVIVLLPNLNLLLLDFIEQQNKKTPSTFAMTGASFEAVRSFEFIHAVRTVLEGLGLSVKAKYLPLDPSVPSPLSVPSIPFDKGVRLAEIRKPADAFDVFLKEHTFSVGLSTRSPKLLPDHRETLKAVIDKLSAAMMGRYPLNIVTFTENNDKWLRLWGDIPLHAKHRTFAGNTHQRFQKNGEAIIFGDLGIIKSYLYATKDLVEAPENPLDIPEIRNADDLFTNLERQINIQEGYLDRQFDISSLTVDPEAVALSEELRLLKTQREEARFSRVNAFVSFAGTNVLGPMDRSILNKAYQETARAEILSKISSLTKTPFGNLYESPDEFGLDKSRLEKDKQELTLDALQTEAANNNFPIFKYNTSNPNVLELKSDTSLVYYQALRLGVERSVARRAAGVVKGQLTSAHASLPVLTVEEAISYLFANDFANGLDDKFRMIKELEKRVSQSLFEDYNLKAEKVAVALSTPMKRVRAKPAYSLDLIASQIAVIAAQMQLEGNAPVIQIDQEKPGDAVSYMSTLLTQVQRRAFNVTLKTVPLFHLSTVGQGMLSNCLLFAQDPPVVKTGTRPNQNFFNSFLSGMYQIIGFKHKISSSGEASSEFSLIGGPVSTTENSDGVV